MSLPMPINFSVYMDHVQSGLSEIYSSGGFQEFDLETTNPANPDYLMDTNDYIPTVREELQKDVDDWLGDVI